MEQNYEIESRFKASVAFEISVNWNGCNYLVIYGSHINGGFCAITNWEISCEMSDSGDTFYNTEKLERAGLSYEAAKAVACAIRDEAKRLL